jgi:hypothetical protein
VAFDKVTLYDGRYILFEFYSSFRGYATGELFNVKVELKILKTAEKFLRTL